MGAERTYDTRVLKKKIEEFTNLLINTHDTDKKKKKNKRNQIYKIIITYIKFCKFI